MRDVSTQPRVGLATNTIASPAMLHYTPGLAVSLKGRECIVTYINVLTYGWVD